MKEIFEAKVADLKTKEVNQKEYEKLQKYYENQLKEKLEMVDLNLLKLFKKKDLFSKDLTIFH